MAAAQQPPVDPSTAVLAPPTRLVASLRRNDRGPFIVHTHHSMIAVTGPAGLPFVVAYCRHVEVPATETLAFAPIPAAPSSQQQQQPQPSAPGNHPHSAEVENKTAPSDVAATTSASPAKPTSLTAKLGGTAEPAPPAVSPPAPSKDKCYLPVREPIYSRYNQKSRTSVAMIPCLGHGRWIVTAACLRSDLTRLAPQHEMVEGAARTRQPDGGKAFFLLPRVSNMQQQPHGAAAATATAPSVRPPAMTDSDDDAPCSNDEGEDEGPRHHPEPRVELNADERAELDFLAASAWNQREYVLLQWSADVPSGPFIGDAASASSLIGLHLSFFRLHSAFFDSTFARAPLEWMFVRTSVRGLAPEQWGYFLRRSQTLFPKTDPESRAQQPPLMVFPNPHKRFCLDLRPRVAGQWDSFLESGYLHEGRLAHATKAQRHILVWSLAVGSHRGACGGGRGWRRCNARGRSAPCVERPRCRCAISRPRRIRSRNTDDDRNTTTVNNTPSTATGGTLSPATTSPHQSAADGGGTGARMPGVDALQATSHVRRKVRKAMATRLDAVRNTRITINRDFRGALYRMREYHHTHRKGTWFDLDFIEFMAELQETDELNASGSAGHTAAAPAGAAAASSEGRHQRRYHTSNDRPSTLMSSGSESDDDDDDLNHGGLVNGPGDDEEVDAAKQRRLADTRITCVTVHPAVVPSTGRAVGRRGQLMSPWADSVTNCRAAAARQLRGPARRPPPRAAGLHPLAGRPQRAVAAPLGAGGVRRAAV
jgi:hypothetical protein